METVKVIKDSDEQIVLLTPGLFDDGQEVELERLEDGSVLIKAVPTSPPA